MSDKDKKDIIIQATQIVASLELESNKRFLNEIINDDEKTVFLFLKNIFKSLLISIKEEIKHIDGIFNKNEEGNYTLSESTFECAQSTKIYIESLFKKYDFVRRRLTCNDKCQCSNC